MTIVDTHTGAGSDFQLIAGGVDSEVATPAAMLRPVLVHDYLLVQRGAERVFTTMCDLWPAAPVSTLLYDPDVFDARLAGHRVRTSGFQRLGLRQQHFKAFMPFFPGAAGRLDVADHDLVISSSSAFGHGVRPDPGAVHVSYCHTPFRYAWYAEDAGLAQAPWLARPALRHQLAKIRAWDRDAAQRDTFYVANSRISQNRIAEFWGREAPIVHPPVELSRFAPGEAEDFLLVVGEIVRHKRFDAALEAARRARRPIKVVGGGADEARLTALYGDSAEFLGRVSDAELSRLYARCAALVMPSVEEFGIAAVEAQASGRPVIAAGAGGALETVVDGKTGLFYAPDDIDALTEILAAGDSYGFDPADCVNNARRFSRERFEREFTQQVLDAVGG
jgi:glycosyltransferase involved in cell wall biosynthesis